MTKRKTPADGVEQRPEEQSFGARMRAARHLADLSEVEAAAKLGFVAVKELADIESGQRQVTLAVLMRATELYGTTMDYLCGLSDDPDRDPASASVRHVKARVTAEVNRMVHFMTRASIDALRNVLPPATDGNRLAGLALEVQAALRTFQRLNNRFDGMHGADTLTTKVEVATDAALHYVANMGRAQRATLVRIEMPNGERAQVSLAPLLEVEAL